MVDITGVDALHGELVNETKVTEDIYDETGSLVRVEKEHVAQTAVSEGRAQHRNIVLGRPVVDRLGVIDLLSKPVDDLTRPNQLS